MTSIRGVEIDEQTVHKLMRGDVNAQTAVFERLSPHVYSMALRVLGDSHAAEDVTQDTFVDVITKAHTVKNPDRFVGWVRTVAINRCYLRIRSPWHKRRIDVEPEEGYEDVDQANSIDIDKALAKLDPKTRLVVWMYCVEGYTHKEIGQILKRSTSYSKVIISRLSQKMSSTDSRSPVEETEGKSVQTELLSPWSTLSCP